MRLYSITNMYMAGIHAGIQTQHSTVRLFVKYDKDGGDTFPQEALLFDWAINHETTVVLNGGMHDSLKELLELFEKWEKKEVNDVLPFAPFFEPGVNNALTSISVIMPQNAIDFMSRIRSTKPETPEYETLKLEMNDSYGKYGIPVLEAIAFLPLAK